MYIKNYDDIPLWAWGKDIEDLKYGVENMESIELRFKEEKDILSSIDFLPGGR